MPAFVVCSACQTKLKVLENSSAKALRCPKCKGVVPLAPGKEKPSEILPPKMAPSPQDEELEVNEAADEDEELEVNEAADEEEESQDADVSEDSPLAKLGFAKVEDPWKQGSLPEEARKTLEKTFAKKEKVFWTGRPSVKLIESKAWIGLVVGPILVLVGVGICLLTSGLAFFVVNQTAAKIMLPIIGGVFGLLFGAIGALAVIFRKRIGGNVQACYVVTNKFAYIYDANTQVVRKFSAQELEEMRCQESNSFPGAGDLIFTYDLHGTENVAVNKEVKDKYGGTPVGFLNIEQVQLVRQMIEEVLIEPTIAKEKQKRKEKQQKKKYRPGWSR
jgi:hypothetical protein